MTAIPLDDALRHRAVQVWPEADYSLLANEIPDAPEMPALPGKWGDFIVQAAEAKVCAPDFVLGAVLSSAAALIGNARHAQPWPSWTEPPILWSLLVGPPSTSKSPAADTVRDVMATIESELAEQFTGTVNDYEHGREVAKIKADAWRDDAREAEKAGRPVPPRPMEANEPEMPQRPRLVITDVSIERCAALVAGNPKGVMLFRDEASAWLANFERRGGSDRPFWLEAFGARPYVVDRQKSPDPIKIDHLSISILATIQPDPLRDLVLDASDDGLSSRFLYFFPSVYPTFRRPRRPADFGFADRALRRLHALQMVASEDGRQVPGIVSFNDEAATTFEQWCAELGERTKRLQGMPANYMGKMRGIAVRLALILQYLAWSQEDEATPEPTEIAASSVDAAIDMVDNYIVPMAFRALAGKRSPGADSDAATVGRWLVGNFTPTINAREMKRTPGFPLRDHARIEAALAVLVDGGWLRPSQAKTGGRMRKDFSVNPAITRALSAVKSAKSVKSQNVQVIQAVSGVGGALSEVAETAKSPFGAPINLDGLMADAPSPTAAGGAA